MLKSPGWETSTKIRHDTEKVTSVFTNRTSKPKPAPLQCPAIKERNPVIQRARTHPHMPSPFGQVLCLDSSMEMYCECMPMQPLLQSVSFLLPLTLWPQQSNALLSPSSDFSWHHLFWNLRGLKSVFKPSLFVNDQGLFWCVTFQRHLDWAPSIQECPTSHPGQKHWHSSKWVWREVNHSILSFNLLFPFVCSNNVRINVAFSGCLQGVQLDYLDDSWCGAVLGEKLQNLFFCWWDAKRCLKNYTASVTLKQAFLVADLSAALK